MTEEEHVWMAEQGDKFWLEFSKMCWRYVDGAPPHLRDEFRSYLGDKTSIYGIRRREP